MIHGRWVLASATAAMMAFSLPAMAADEAAPAKVPPEIADITWEWIAFNTPKEQLEVPEPKNYTLTLTSDGAAALQIDCNRGVSQVTMLPDNGIRFSPIGATMMLCPGPSLEHRFAGELERVTSFLLKDGGLFLELPYDSGTLAFRRAQ